MAGPIPLEFTFRAMLNSRREIIGKLAAQAKRMISERVTDHGLDIENRPLRGKGGPGKYSPEYEKHRRDKGRRVDMVNLTFRRDMLRNFQVIEQSVDGGTAVMGFPAPEERLKAEVNTKRSGQFIGLTPKEQKLQADLVRDLLGKVISRTKRTIVIA